MIITEVGDKVNFIDENDIFVGCDLGQFCCEKAGYFLSYKDDEQYVFKGNTVIEKDEIKGYIFDTKFFKCVKTATDWEDEGGQVCFRLTSKGKKDIYLHLYNSHNGYYAHEVYSNILDIKERI